MIQPLEEPDWYVPEAIARKVNEVVDLVNRIVVGEVVIRPLPPADLSEIERRLADTMRRTGRPG